MQRDYEFTPEPGATQRKAVARIVACGECTIALPQHTTLEIVDHPQAVPVPGESRHALGLLEWQGRRIPLIDAAVRLGSGAVRDAAPRYALVVAMQAQPGAPIEHGAIALDALPQSVEIGDEAWCAVPAGPQWDAVAISSFRHEGEAVAVVDTARLFARPRPRLSPG